MSRKKNNKLGAVIFGPVLVIGGVLALWENEGRFDYYAAARNASVINSSTELAGEPIAYTNALDTDIPIYGDYVTEFVGFHVVSRYAEIYSWDQSKDSEGHTKWKLGWYSNLDSNSRNSGLQKTLSSRALYPDGYELGHIEISAENIHFVDDYVSISPAGVRLSRRGEHARTPEVRVLFPIEQGSFGQPGRRANQLRGIPNAPTASYFGVVFGGVAVGKQFEMNDGLISDIIGNDGILHHLVNGEREAALVKIKQDLTKKTWMVRIVGTLAIVIGIYVLFSVFMSLLYRIPVIGAAVGYGVSPDQPGAGPVAGLDRDSRRTHPPQPGQRRAALGGDYRCCDLVRSSIENGRG